MLQSGHGSRDRRTDGRTDGRTEWNQYTPQQLRCSGGIIMIQVLSGAVWDEILRDSLSISNMQRCWVLHSGPKQWPKNRQVGEFRCVTIQHSHKLQSSDRINAQVSIVNKCQQPVDNTVYYTFGNVLMLINLTCLWEDRFKYLRICNGKMSIIQKQVLWHITPCQSHHGSSNFLEATFYNVLMNTFAKPRLKKSLKLHALLEQNRLILNDV